MPICSCGAEYSDKRAALGYTDCLDCGQRKAQVRIAQRNQEVIPLFNKGGYGLIPGQTLAEKKRSVRGLACKVGRENE